MDGILKQSAAQWQDFLDREFDPYAMTKYQILLSWLGEIRGQQILVVGSGSGEFAALLAHRGGVVTAVDVDQPSIDLTQRTAQKLGVQIKTFCAQVETLPEQQQFDLVVATDVIEHIADDVAAVQKLIRLTTSSGQLLVTVPALNSLFGYHDEILGHFRRYNKNQLKRLMTIDGLEIERLRYFGFFLIPVALIVSRWLRRPYPVKAAGTTQKQRTVLGAIIRALFCFEAWLRPPAGTSILLLAKKL